LRENPYFEDFVRLLHTRYGHKRMAPSRAVRLKWVRDWFSEYLRSGCGPAG